MPNLSLFEVRIGKQGAPRLSFAAEAASSGDAVDQFLALAEEGERVEAWAVGAKPQAAIAFPVAVARNELAQAELRNSAAAIRAREFHRRNDAHALDLQVQMQGFIGSLS